MRFVVFLVLVILTYYFSKLSAYAIFHLSDVRHCTEKVDFLYRSSNCLEGQKNIEFWQRICYEFQDITYTVDILDNFPFVYKGRDIDKAKGCIFVNPSIPNSAVIFKKKVMVRDRIISFSAALLSVASLCGAFILMITV